MKKLLLTFSVLLPLSFSVFAQSKESAAKTEPTDIAINPKTGFPIITEKPFLMFNEGVTFAQVNRIETQKERSNFVRENYMLGAFLSIQSGNMKPLNSILRVAAYYPFYHTFNGMRVYPKQTILYAFDLFYGPMIQTDMWKYVRLNFAAGLHYMYQLTDEYHMHYLGGAVIAGLELPVARNWTVLLNGTFTLDYPNFGTNQKVQPFNYAWQYQLELGVRYSIKNPNNYCYIKSRKDRLMDAGIIEDPYLTNKRINGEYTEANRQLSKEAQEKTKYMTTGEKAAYNNELSAKRSALKAEKNQKLKEARELVKQKLQEDIQAEKAEKEKKNQEKLKKAEEEKLQKAKEAEETKARMEELKKRQDAENKAKTSAAKN